MNHMYRNKRMFYASFLVLLFLALVLAFQFPAPAAAQTCAGLVQEAEEGLLSGSYLVGSNSSASGGMYIYTPEEVADANNIAQNTNTASYCFEVETAGIYRIKGWIYAPLTSSNSFFVQIDGEPSNGYLWDTVYYRTGFLVDFVNHRQILDPVEVTLAAGQHDLVFFMREAGAGLDKLELELVQASDPPTATSAPTVTNTPVPATASFTPTPTNTAPAATATFTPTPTNTPVPATATFTPAPTNTAPAATATFTTTPTNTPPASTATFTSTPTNTALAATATFTHTPTNTSVPATATFTPIPTNTPLVPTATFTPTPTNTAPAATATFTPTPTQPSGSMCGGLVQEAESGELAGTFVVGSDPAASGGLYIHGLEGSGNTYFLSGNAASYCFNVETAGVYRIRGWTWADTSDNNSFYVQVDGAPSSGYLWDTRVSTQYPADYVNDRGGANPVEVTLAVGEHSLVVYNREDGTRLDKLELELVQASDPPTATPTPMATNTPVPATATFTPTPTNTAPAPTATFTPTPTNTAPAPTATFTPTPTNTAPAPTATITPTPTNTAPAPTATFTPTPTNTPVPATATFTPTPTNTAPAPTATFTPTPTNTPLVPTATFTPTPTSTPLACEDPVRIMPLGDSITRGSGSSYINGYRRPLYQSLVGQGYSVDFVGSQVHGLTDFDQDHEGHSGWSADGGVTGSIAPNVYNWLVIYSPEVVLLHIGTNDISESDADAGEVALILDEIDRYSTDITVVLALIVNRQTYSPETTQYNADLLAMAEARILAGDNILIVDMESALDYTTDMYDNLHPNNGGYAKMANVWLNALTSFLPVCSTSMNLDNNQIVFPVGDLQYAGAVKGIGK